MLSRPVQLIPTSISDHHHHHHHHPHITHVHTVKPDFSLSSPTTNENPQHSKTFDSSGHQSYIHMQLLPSSTSNSSDSINSSQQSLQFTLPTTHLYSSSPSSLLFSTTQRSNNHQSTITTPIIREMQIDEKQNDLTNIKNRNKNRTRLPLQPSTQQTIRQPKKHKLIEE